MASEEQQVFYSGSSDKKKKSKEFFRRTNEWVSRSQLYLAGLTYNEWVCYVRQSILLHSETNLAVLLWLLRSNFSGAAFIAWS